VDSLIERLLTGKIEAWVLLFMFIIIIGSLVITLLKKIKLIKLKEIITPLGSASFDIGDDKVDLNKRSPHADCVHAKDIIIVLHKQRDNLKECEKIERTFIPRDMMNIAEDILDHIISKMSAIFLKLLKDIKGTNIDLVKNPAFMFYELSTKAAKKEIIKEVRRMIHENSFVEKSMNGNWEEYKKNKIKNLLDIMTEALNRFYIWDEPSREAVYDMNIAELMDREKEFYLPKIINKCLDDLLNISKHYHVKINNLESEIDIIVCKLFGE